MKVMYKYCILILNYNSSQNTLDAIKSISEMSTFQYKICVIDNHSSDKDVAFLKESQAGHPDVDFLFLQENLGYAYGNNYGFRIMRGKYDFQYVIIMNPDVVLTQNGTDKHLINTIETAISKCGKKIVGAQPLVWNYNYSNDPNMQLNIRKVYSYREVCIQSNILLRTIFRKQYRSSNYLYDRPYSHPIEFEVPSGAFFIIDADVFNTIGGFDERTFLYEEEMILGYKLKSRNYSMILDTDVIVKHAQGASTGYTRFHVTKRKYNILFSSRKVYLKEYLKCSKAKILYIRFFLAIDFLLHKLACSILKPWHRKLSY